MLIIKSKWCSRNAPNNDDNEEDKEKIHIPPEGNAKHNVIIPCEIQWSKQVK